MIIPSTALDNSRYASPFWREANVWHYNKQYIAAREAPSQEELQRAAEAGQKRELRRQLHHVKHFLFQAIASRELEKVKEYVGCYNHLLECRTDWGATPLAVACAVGDKTIVTALLDAGADICAVDEVGAGPLHSAAYKGHNDVIGLLFASRQGGNIGREYLLGSRTKQGETAAMAAAKGGHLDTLKLLVDMGASLKSTDAEGVDVLMLSARRDRVEVMKYLLGLPPPLPASLGATDKQGRNALMHAASTGAAQAVAFLLSVQDTYHPPLQVGISDVFGNTALHHAFLGGSLQVATLLSEAGLRVEELATGGPRGPADFLALASRTGNVELVRWMTNQGVGTVPALAEDDGGDGPLFAAVKGGSKQVVSLLLEQGARLEVRDRKGRTPLAWCAAHGKTDMARFLHSKGASLLARDLQGNVPRVLAYKHRHAATAEALTELARQDYLLRDDDVSSVAGEVGPFVLVPPRDGEQQLRQQLQLQQQQPSVVVQALQ